MVPRPRSKHRVRSWKRSQGKSVAQQEDEPPIQQMTTRSMKANDFRSDTLSVTDNDGSILASFVVDTRRMRSTCSNWSKLPSLGNGHKRLQIENVNFEEDNAKDALRAVLDIIHRKNQDRNFRGVNPRLLFYSVLIHESLGAPSSIGYPEMKSFESTGSLCVPFFPPGSIKREISRLVREVKYLYRVKDWLLLAVVADKLGLKPTMQSIRDNIVLFCEAHLKDMPNDLRQNSIKDNEWALVKGLRLIDDRMLEMRILYVERIFHGIRLLSHQVNYMDKGIPPTPDEFKIYQDYRVAACPDCYSVSSDEFHHKPSAAKLWPLGPSSYTFYLGSVIHLIRTIGDIEEDLVRRVNRSMQSQRRGENCNQLTHLYNHLRNLRKELFE
ncbi:hypothetical protein FLONG3_1874 [Fusarium longipes]|uniref:Uncharacterized protein n=1 Tax=Fusarium longipes TaxID=694270 RepID=A0A395T5H3_9HYPO|nr:hypothetical protein FLONG3_1874 [Fusarium longipes]